MSHYITSGLHKETIYIEIEEMDMSLSPPEFYQEEYEKLRRQFKGLKEEYSSLMEHLQKAQANEASLRDQLKTADLGLRDISEALRFNKAHTARMDADLTQALADKDQLKKDLERAQCQMKDLDHRLSEEIQNWKSKTADLSVLLQGHQKTLQSQTATMQKTLRRNQNLESENLLLKSEFDELAALQVDQLSQLRRLESVVADQEVQYRDSEQHRQELMDEVAHFWKRLRVKNQMKTVYKKIIRSLRNENSELNLRASLFEHDNTDLRNQWQRNEKARQEFHRQTTESIHQMREENAEQLRAVKAEGQALLDQQVTTFQEGLRNLRADYEKEIFELKQAQRDELKSGELQRKKDVYSVKSALEDRLLRQSVVLHQVREELGNVKPQLLSEIQSRQQLAASIEHLQQRLQIRDVEIEEQRRQVEQSTQKFQELQLRCEKDLLDCARVQGELRQKDIEHREEIKALKSQLNSPQ